MNRLHVSLSVDDLASSVRFYSTLFAAEPVRLEDDYARWMLDDPRVNFAISTRAPGRGVNHLGIQVEDEAGLDALRDRLAAAAAASDAQVLDEGETTCCYAHSTKQWIDDPSGVPWEAFLTHEDAAEYGVERTDGASPDAKPERGAAQLGMTGGGCCA